MTSNLPFSQICYFDISTSIQINSSSNKIILSLYRCVSILYRQMISSPCFCFGLKKVGTSPIPSKIRSYVL